MEMIVAAARARELAATFRIRLPIEIPDRPGKWLLRAIGPIRDDGTVTAEFVPFQPAHPPVRPERA